MRRARSLVVTTIKALRRGCELDMSARATTDWSPESVAFVRKKATCPLPADCGVGSLQTSNALVAAHCADQVASLPGLSRRWFTVFRVRAAQWGRSFTVFRADPAQLLDGLLDGPSRSPKERTSRWTIAVL